MNKHGYVSAVSDGGDSSVVRPSDWNAAHVPVMGAKRVLVEDDLLCCINTSGRVSRLNWVFTANTYNNPDVGGTVNRPGQVQLSVNNNALWALNTPADSTGLPYHTSDVKAFTIMAYIFGVTSGSYYRFGLLTSGAHASSPGANAVYFSFQPANSAKWQGITRASSSSATPVTDTGANVAASTWYQLTAVQDQATPSWEFFVNGVSIGTQTTQIPAAQTNLCHHGQNSEGSAQQMFMDYAGVLFNFTSNRYT